MHWNDAGRRGRGFSPAGYWLAERTGAEPSAGATASAISGACTAASATASAISGASPAVAAGYRDHAREQQAAKPKPKPQVRQGGPNNAGRAPPRRGRAYPRLHPKLPQRRQRGQAALKTRMQFPPEFVTKVESLNAARGFILPKIGVNTYDVDRQTIQDLPQGENTPLDKVLLQTPGVSQDSAAAGNLHIRNEHANLQYRINGIQLPDGLSGFGNILETSFIGNMAVVTGALPAQYGLRTAGLIDIQSRTGASIQQARSASMAAVTAHSPRPSNMAA